jgi:hypothetical protein
MYESYFCIQYSLYSTSYVWVKQAILDESVCHENICTQIPEISIFNCKIYIFSLYHGIRQPEGGSRARNLVRYFFLSRRSDRRIKKTA